MRANQIKSKFLLLAATLAWVAAAALSQTAPHAAPPRPRSSAPRPKVNPTPAMPPDSPVRPAVEAGRAGDFEKAAALLSALDPKAMPAPEARRWRIFAQSYAVRTGNLPMLKRANQEGEGLLFADARQILHAWELAQVSETVGAKAVLQKVTDPQFLDERSRRRYLALQAAIAQMEGDRKTERIYIAKLVDYVGLWQDETCQSCHENPEKWGDDVTSLDVRNHWIGERFSSILRADGDAARVRQQAVKDLKLDPQNEVARLRLAYALRAEGRNAQATEQLRRLSWAVFPDRPYKEPDNNIRFPGVMPLKKTRRPEEFMPENHVLSAADYLKAGAFRQAQREIAELGPKETLPLRLRYRAEAIEARMARLQNEAAAERNALAALVRTAALLPRTESANPSGDKPPFTDWQGWWVTRRLSALGDTQTAEQARSLQPLPVSGEVSVRDLNEYP